MRLNEELLLERALIAEYTFGYELEAFIDTNKEDKLKELNDVLIGAKERGYIPGGSLQQDGSLRTKGKNSLPFEFAVKPQPLTPANITKTSNFLRFIARNHIYVNSSCGFHIHIKLPVLTDKDYFWIIACLAFDDNMRNKISSMGGTLFSNERFSSTAIFDEIKKIIFTKDLSKLNSFFTGEKYRVLRIHPNTKTLEWRGPRGFLPSFNETKSISKEGGSNPVYLKAQERIKSFLNLLLSFVNWINSTALTKKELNGVSKEVIMKSLTNEIHNPKAITDKTSDVASAVKKFPWLKQAIDNKILTGASIKNNNGIFTIDKGIWSDNGRKLPFEKGITAGKDFVFKDGIYKGSDFYGRFEDGEWKTDIMNWKESAKWISGDYKGNYYKELPFRGDLFRIRNKMNNIVSGKEKI